nr:ComEC/Rec2 family competence protein [Psychromicrobium silvestre]
MSLPISIHADGLWGSVQQGQRISTIGVLGSADPSNPGRNSFTPRTGPRLLAGVTDSGPFGGLRRLLRISVQELWKDRWPEAAELLPGLVTGDRSAQSEELSQLMKTVGMTHVSAVSGMNCSIVVLAIILAARSIRMPRVFAALCGALGLLFLIGVVGPDPSVLRAAVMGTLGTLSLLGGRSKHPLALLHTAVIVLLLANPWLAISFGFILSVLATAGLVVLGPGLRFFFERFLPGWAATLIAIPLAAQLCCAPVIVLLTPRLTPYALPANILAAPLVSLGTLLGTLALPLLPLLPWLATPLLWLAGLCAGGVVAICRVLAALPGSSLPWLEGAPGAILLGLLSAAFLGVFLAAEHWWRNPERFKERASRWLPFRVRWVLQGTGMIAVASVAGSMLATWLARAYYRMPP